MKRSMSIAATLFVMLLGSSCSSDTTAIDDRLDSKRGGVASISVALSAASATVGQTVTASALVLDAAGVPMNRTVSWTSSNSAVATVSSTGTVTALAVGTAQISASTASVSGNATFTVTAANPGPAPVASVSVALSASATTVGQSVQATATTRDAASNVLTGRSIAWSSSNGGVATVSATGVVTAVAAGSAQIAASSEGKTGSATLVVNVPAPVPVASVSVALAASTLNAAQTTQATATTRDASNNVLAGRVIAWSSSNAGVASVSASGVVTAVAAGSAQITATSESITGSATLTVSVPSPSAGCASPQAGWIWCDDFEVNRTASYFEYDNAGGSFVRATGVGVNGTMGMRGHFNAGQSNAGSLKVAFGKIPTSLRAVDAGTAIYREIFWRMRVKNQAGWTGGGGDKLSRATSIVNNNWAQSMIAHVWAGAGAQTNQLMVDPASGTDASGNLITTTYNDFTNLRWLGLATSTTPVFDAAHVGQWHCIEARAKLNDAGSSNGVQELWIDGVLEAQRTGLNFVGAYSAFGINAVFFENYWNAGSPVAQDRYFDDLVVSTQRIGC